MKSNNRFNYLIAVGIIIASTDFAHAVVLNDPTPGPSEIEIAINNIVGIFFEIALLFSLLLFILSTIKGLKSKRALPRPYYYFIWFSLCFSFNMLYVNLLRDCIYQLYPFGLVYPVLASSLIPIYYFGKLSAKILNVDFWYIFSIIFIIYSGLGIQLF